MILTVLPRLAPEGNAITLVMSPEMIEKPEWKSYEAVVTLNDGTTHVATCEQPFFKNYSLQTSILVKLGSTVLVSNGMRPLRGSHTLCYWCEHP